MALCEFDIADNHTVYVLGRKVHTMRGSDCL